MADNPHDRVIERNLGGTVDSAVTFKLVTNSSGLR
jgi:hypothetical protein